MYHHHITRALAEAHVADMQRTAAHNRQTSELNRRRAGPPQPSSLRTAPSGSVCNTDEMLAP
jgi:hypothetical protein